MESKTTAQHLADSINKQMSDIPTQVTDAVLQEIPWDSPVGSALRERGGETLRAYLGNLSPDQLPHFAERMINLNQALDHETLKHTPDLASLLKVADAAGGMAEGNADNFEDAQRSWYDTLKTLAPTIPGQDDKGNVVSRYQLYAEQPQVNAYSPVEAAREALTDPNTPDEDKSYWHQILRDNVPELATHAGEILPEMIPANMDGVVEADVHNDALGKSAGQMMNILTGSSQTQTGGGETTLTQGVGGEGPEVETPQTITMDDVPMSEPESVVDPVQTAVYQN